MFCDVRGTTYFPPFLVGRPSPPVFGHHRDFRHSGRDPAPVRGNISFFNRISPDVGHTYLRLSVDRNAGNRVSGTMSSFLIITDEK